MKKKNYFVLYETDLTINSFLIYESKSAPAAWDEAVAAITKKHPNETAVIQKFERVK